MKSLFLSSLLVLLILQIQNIQCQDEHIIQGVPYYRQVTKYNCGDASLQMVLGYYGRNVSQKEIDDSMRTSRSEGTLSYDIVRGAQFSILSASQGTDKKKHEDTHGYKHSPYGLMAVGYSSDECWMDELKQLIANDVPVICLMNYDMNPADGAHFRVIFGYNDTAQEFISMDPWDRDGQPQVFNMSYTDFQYLWNYTEFNSPRGQPYFGVAIWDLQPSVQVYSSGNLSVISSTLQYSNIFPIQNNINTTLPTAITQFTGIHLPTAGTHLVEGSQSSYLTFNVAQDDSLTYKWEVECTTSPCQGTFEILYQYLIVGEVPETYDTKNHNYPMYQYQDIIGKNYTGSF